MQRLSPTLDQHHTLRQATHLMIDTTTYTITITNQGQPVATITIQDILNATRQGHNTKTTRLKDIIHHKQTPTSLVSHLTGET